MSAYWNSDRHSPMDHPLTPEDLDAAALRMSHTRNLHEDSDSLSDTATESASPGPPGEAETSIELTAVGAATAPLDESQPLRDVTKERVSEESNSTESCHQNEDSVWKSWYLEALSCMLAVGCLLAIILILSLHQGQPLPNWPELISVNTLVAVFTAIYKASLIMPVAEGLGQLKWEWFSRPRSLEDMVVFDEASRGPWGSLKLISKQAYRHEHSHVAIIGAMITIAALAIDPFSQAMIEHRSCPQSALHGTAQTARANNYTITITGPYGGGPVAGSLDPVTLSALYTGLIEPAETESLIDTTCTTGNCTFGNDDDAAGFFSSLAMCHSCQNITEEVTFTNSTDSFGATSYKLPSGLESVSRPGPGVVLSAKSLRGYLSHEDPSLFGFEVLTPAASCDNCHPADEYEPLAVRCRLIPCVQSYRAGVTNGRYWEKHGDTAPQELRLAEFYGANNWQQNAYALVTNYTLVDGEKRRCDPSAQWIPESVLVDAKSHNVASSRHSLYRLGDNYEPDWKYFPQECVWTFDMTSAGGIGQVLGELVSQNLTMNRDVAVEGPPWLRVMWAHWRGNFSTVEGVVQGLANTLTAAIRNSAEKQALKYANGVAISMQTCIYVSWGWIAYPAVLIVLQTTFSILVLAGPRTRSGRGRPRPLAWKSSPLALLFHGLDDQVRRENKDLRTVAEMDEAGRKIKVQLSRMDGVEDGGWRLCKD